MAKRIGALIIHGIGSQERGYSGGFQLKVRDRLGAQAAEVVLQETYWADVLEAQEKELWDCMRTSKQVDGRPLPLDWTRLREFVLHNLGDAAAYQRGGPDDHADADSELTTPYVRIHERISTSLRSLKAQLEDRDAPIVVFASSLGAHIASNYIWDRQAWARRSPNTPDPMEPLESLIGLVTMGCQIPLFSLAWPIAKPVLVPGAGITRPELIAEARWLNFYDRDDLLGWPVRPVYEKNLNRLNNAQRATVGRIEEREVNVGSPLTSWTPFSHTAYDEDGDVLKPAVDFLKRVLAAF
ncbi:MAG: hypothetical protein AAGI08_08045 [Bacteroidota bacterium]